MDDQAMAWESYASLVRKLLPGRVSSGTGVPELLKYFDGHSPRFRMLTDIMRANLAKEPVHTVLDAGTEFPFASMYMHSLTGAWILCAGMGEGLPVSPFMWFTKLNLCRPPLLERPVSDLTICTEVLEHLPCNLYRVIDWLKTTTRKWLLLSFPQGGANATGYDADFPAEYDLISKPHRREFNGETTKLLVAYTGWHVEDARDSNQPAYGAPIRNVLLRRPE